MLSPIPPILPSSRERRHLGQLAVKVDSWSPSAWIPARPVEQAQVDHVHPVDAQAAQVGLDPGAQLLGPLGGAQPALGVALGADLAHQHQVFRVRVRAARISSLATPGP